MFAALIFGLMIGFMSNLLSALMIVAEKNLRRTEMHVALDSAFAEYNKELFDTWDLFAVDMRYDGQKGDVENVLERIRWYGDFQKTPKKEAVALLSDAGGENFLKQAEDYMLHTCRLDIPEKLLNMTGKSGASYLDNTGKILRKMDKLELPDISLPKIPVIDDAFLTSLLETSLSEAQIQTETLPSRRSLKAGSMTLKRGNFEKSGLLKYIGDHFGSFIENGEGDLLYEKEYLIAGGAGDKENLLHVVRRILVMRYADNMRLIMSDAKKQKEAAAFATGVTVVAMMPHLEEPLKYALLVAWAFAESAADTRQLLAGGKLPFPKKTSDWVTDREDIFSSSKKKASGAEDGYDYEMLLDLFLLCGKRDCIALRCLDLIELDMMSREAGAGFQCDRALVGIRISGEFTFPRKTVYKVQAQYNYR